MKHARDKHKSEDDNFKGRATERARREYREPENRKATPERRTRLSDAERSVPRSDSIYESAPKRATAKRTSKKPPKKKSAFWAGFRITLVICICIGLVITLGVGAGMYAAITKEIDAMDFDGIAYNFSSTVYANDENGNAVEVEHLHNDGNREWIDSDKIPQVMKDAVVSIEDERFYSHHGVDLKRTGGAIIGWCVSKVSGSSPSYGGSTITQQVIKNITNEKEKTVTRKIKEMMRAVALEKKFSKDQILTMYLNIVYFGNQCYGVESSSKMYFAKTVSDLNLEQAAMIAGITQRPSAYDPFKHPEDTIKKRNTVLKKMNELGKITDEEYNAASEKKLGVTKYKPLSSSVYSYFVDQVINEVINDLQNKKGYSETFATQQVFSGGLKIYTTMDSSIQSDMESVYTNTSNFPVASKGAQSAMVIIDPYKGEIKGIVGGVGKKTESRGLNRATQSKRQPGSSIKPLSVYSPALETGKITAASILEDEKITIGDWTPKNSYTGFKGDMLVNEAIGRSANIPAVKVLQSLGVDVSYNYMTNKYHFTTLVNTDKNYSSLALGGLTTGVTPKEMAAAYGVFANGGEYITPHIYTKVIDSSGKVLLEYEPESNKVISPANAYIMSDFLSGVVNESYGTGRNARLSKMPVYGKTGTTNDNYDKWFIGYTPYYVGAVWYGFDSPSSLSKAGVSNNVSTLVWKKVMEKVHANLSERALSQPSGVTEVSICSRTGKLASKGCDYAIKQYFAAGTAPTKFCNNASGSSTKKSSSTHKASASATAKPNGSEDEENDNTSQGDSGSTSGGSTATKQPATQAPSENSGSQSGNEVITLD